MSDPMSCDTARPLLPAYLDGELDAGSSAALDRHVAGCDACRLALERGRAVRSAVREDAPRWQAPADLAAELAHRFGTPSRVRTRRPASRDLVPFAAGAALAASVGLWVNFEPTNRSTPYDVLTRELTAGHARALVTRHLYDVASSDRHQVKPWLDARLDFAVHVPDLAASGFVLDGGRLDYLDRRPVAALVYRRGGHVISLFSFPSDRDAPPAERVEQGYRLVGWRTGGFDHWAVSDLNATDLQAFVAAVKSAEEPK